VVGQELQVACLNPNLSACTGNGDSGVVTDELGAAILGAFVPDPSQQLVPQLVSRATATRTTISYVIRPDAYWDWGGRRLPVTYKDFVYTWKQVIDPHNPVDIDRLDYQLITGYTHKGLRQITFHWKKPPDDNNWRLLFGWVYPSQALAGIPYAKVFQTCVCGNDGKPVADGPYYVASFSRSKGTTLHPNPTWYGTKPALQTIVFKPLPSAQAEVAAMRDGSVDLINPTSSFQIHIGSYGFGSYLLPLLHTPGVVDAQTQLSGGDEHIEIQEGPKGNPLLRRLWFRQALMLGIDRNAIINRSFGALDQGVTVRNALIYPPTDTVHYRPHFAKWNYDPQKAIALLREHCTGGPSAPSPTTTAVWTCDGTQASLRFMYELGDAARAASFHVVRDDLKQIGIAVGGDGLTKAQIFGTTGLPSSDYDLAELIWLGSEPASWVSIWGCNGAVNWSHYCDQKVTALLNQANASGLDPARQTELYEEADALMADDIPVIPLYDRPWPLFRKATLLGVVNHPDGDFTWNIQNWHWAH
jgi:peptide/nickel transport system substrate-binding protein